MKWSLVWLAILSAVSGCCETGANRYDPFSIYGPRLVPPPATGTLGQAPGTYYQGPVAPATQAPLNTGQQLLPVPSLSSPPQAANSPAPRTSGNWVPAAEQVTHSPAPRSRQVVHADGSLRPSDRLPWRIPNSVRGQVQPAGAVEPLETLSNPQPLPADFNSPPQAFVPPGMTEITELPRPVRPQFGGIPSAAVFPAVPGSPTVESVIYDQPSYDYRQVEPAIADGDGAPPPWDAYSYPAVVYSDQPVGYVESPASNRGHVVSTSERSDAWRQRR